MSSHAVQPGDQHAIGLGRPAHRQADSHGFFNVQDARLALGAAADYGPGMAVTTASTNHDSFRRMIKHYNAGDFDGYLAGYALVHGENSQGGVGGVIRQRQAFRWGLDGRGRSRWALGDHHGAGLDGRDRLGRFVRAGAGSDVNDAAHVDQRL